MQGGSDIVVRQLLATLRRARLRSDGRNVAALCPRCGGDEFGVSTRPPYPFQCFRKRRCGYSGRDGRKLVGAVKYPPAFVWLSRKEEAEVGVGSWYREPVRDYTRVYEHPYLSGRGFVWDGYHRHEVGVSRRFPCRVLFPITRNGRLVGTYLRSTMQRRSMFSDFMSLEEPTKPIRKHLVLGRHKRSLLYCYDLLSSGCETVVVVEGVLSCIAVWRNLGLGVGGSVGCVATLGSNVFEEQTDLLKEKGIRKVVLWLESDSVKMGRRLDLTKQRLATVFGVENVLRSYITDRDPADWTSTETEYMYSTADLW